MTEPLPTSYPPFLTSRQYRLLGAVVVELRGEIDLATEEAMNSALTNAMDTVAGIGAAGPDGTGAAALLVCDLTHVGFMSCSGLTILLRTQEALSERGARMRVVARASVVVKLIEVTALDGTLGLCASLWEAIRDGSG